MVNTFIYFVLYCKSRVRHTLEYILCVLMHLSVNVHNITKVEQLL